jgi:four helix bundle protein
MNTGWIKTFEDLECWKACRRLRLFVAKDVVPTLPKEERFGLTAQILDAARSTTANLAEGYGRYHYMDNAKFCSNSRGSCWEVLDHLITATDEELIPAEMLATGRDLVNTAVKLINGYMSYLRRAGTRSDVKETLAQYVSVDEHNPESPHETSDSL